MASPHRNFDPLEVRRAYWRHEGNVRATAEALGTSRETIYTYLGRAEKSAPMVVPAVTLKDLDPADADAQALAVYVRSCLDRVGVKKA